MKKVFISQPMVDRTDKQINLERAIAANAVSTEIGEPVEIIDSICQEERSPIGYLAYSIEKLSEADVAYFCKGWQDYRGCRIEQRIASEYGVQVIMADFDPHKTVVGQRIDAGLWD